MKLKSFITLKIKSFSARWKKEKADMKEYQSKLPNTPLHNKVHALLVVLFYTFVALALCFIPADASVDPSSSSFGTRASVPVLSDLAGSKWVVTSSVQAPISYGLFTVRGIYNVVDSVNVYEFTQLFIGYRVSNNSVISSVNRISGRSLNSYFNLLSSNEYEIQFSTEVPITDKSLIDYVSSNWVYISGGTVDPDIEAWNNGYNAGLSVGQSLGFFGNFFLQITEALDNFIVFFSYSALDVIKIILGATVVIWLMRLLAGG